MTPDMSGWNCTHRENANFQSLGETQLPIKSFITVNAGRSYFYPISREDAQMRGSPLFTAIGTVCPSCKTVDPVRYVKYERCYSCLLTFEPTVPYCKHAPHPRREGNRGVCLTCKKMRSARLSDWDGRDLRIADDPCPSCEKRTFVTADTRECLGCVTNLPTIAPPDMDRTLARHAGMTMYEARKPCLRGHLPVRYVSTSGCVQCHAGGREPTVVTNTDTPTTYNARADEPTMEAKHFAQIGGHRFFRTGRPCRRGHIGLRYASTGNCIECKTGMPAAPYEMDDLRFDRRLAYMNNERLYNPVKPCAKGHKAPRYVLSDGCVECSRLAAATRPSAEAVVPPDAPISHSGRSLARRLGFKLYDTGNACPNGHSPAVRYVSSGACRQCTADRQRLTARSAVVHADRTVNTEVAT